MFEDRYGLAVSTKSADAHARYGDAMDRALALRSGAKPLLEKATEIDGGFALAWALLGLQLRAEGDLPGGNALVQRAAAMGDSVTERERSHLRVLTLFTSAAYGEARAAALAHLATWPGDAVVLLQSHYVFNIFTADLDRRERHHELSASVADRVGDDWFVLSELAFTAEETGAYAEARILAERALELNPHSGPAAHALAHAYLETGATDDGDRWLAAWLGSWADPSQFACHLTWHLALLRLANGAALTDEVTDVLSFVGRSIGALGDGASLLWRLHLAGEADLPWATLAGLPSPLGFSFSNYHRGLVLAGLRDVDGLIDYERELRQLAATGHPSAGTCADVIDALRCLIDGDVVGAANRLVDVERLLPSLGGSRAQLEVLEDTTIKALQRAGRDDEARSRLARRLARRPTTRDQAWLTALGSSTADPRPT